MIFLEFNDNDKESDNSQTLTNNKYDEKIEELQRIIAEQEEKIKKYKYTSNPRFEERSM